MTKDTRIILLVVAILLIVTAAGSVANQKYAADKRELSDSAVIMVRIDEIQTVRLTLDDIRLRPAVEFSAKLKSSIMDTPEDHVYTGVEMNELLSLAGVSGENKSQVVVRAVDGYQVALPIAEVRSAGRVFLVYQDNGDYLGVYGQPGGIGPYMLVIPSDRFSQRWVKYVCEIELR